MILVLKIETQRDPTLVYTYLKALLEKLPEDDIELEAGNVAASRLFNRIHYGIEMNAATREWMRREIERFFEADNGSEKRQSTERASER